MEQKSINNTREIDLIELLKLFAKQKVVIFISVLVCIVIAAVYIFTCPPRYSSSMEVVIRKVGGSTVEITNALKARSNLGIESSDNSIELNILDTGNTYIIKVTADDSVKAYDLCYSVVENYIQTEKRILDKQYDDRNDVVNHFFRGTELSETGNDYIQRTLLNSIINVVPTVYVVREPILADSPDNYPDKKKVILIAIVLGILMGCSYVVYRKVNFSGQNKSVGDEI